MKISTTDEKLEKIKSDALAVFLFEGEKPSGQLQKLDYTISGTMAEAMKLGDFKGKLYEVASLYTHGKINSKRVLVVGLGKKKDFEPVFARNAAGVAARYAIKLEVQKWAVCFEGDIDAEDVIEGVGLAAYDPALYKTKKNGKVIVELILKGKSDQKIVDHSQKVVESVNWVRKMVSEPANMMTPAIMAQEARKLAKEFGFEIEIFNDEQSAKKGLGAFVGIAKGSEEPSYFITMRYRGKSKKTLGVVGKGITFDSGGISIKPSEKMHEMKMDMSGAAAVFGFMRLVGQLKPKVNVVAVTPLSENLPGGKALKPGDVLKALNGKTIEVLNTDAEGRVVLADGLAYAAKMGATHIVDLATLTGAVIVALGTEASAILGKPNSWIQAVREASESAGERVWELPIYPEHSELLHSDIADLANVPPSRGAGVIAGAVFLKEFVPKNLPWAHLDIAGTAWLGKEKPYMAKGPTGVGVRTLVKLLDQLEKA